MPNFMSKDKSRYTKIRTGRYIAVIDKLNNASCHNTNRILNACGARIRETDKIRIVETYKKDVDGVVVYRKTICEFFCVGLAMNMV